MITKGKVPASKIPIQQRNIMGIRALSGDSVTEIAQECGTNRQFVYSQKARVKRLVEPDEKTSKYPCVILDKQAIKKIIVGCMLICKGSTEDTQRFFDWVFDTGISIGKISATINEAASKAEEWNSSVDLGDIKTGANDEIFQSNSPVLVGTDPLTTFTYMMEQADSRDSTTWGYHFLEKEKHQNLNLETSVNDGGTGLRKGLKDAYPEAEIQLDTFHTERDISKAVLASERSAYKDIEKEEKLLKKAIKKETSENLQKYEEAVSKTNKSINAYDTLRLLYVWIIELLSIGGYFYCERVDLFKFIISEIEKLQIKNGYLEKAIKFIKENLCEILNFVKMAEISMGKLAVKENIPVETLRKMWKQLRYSYKSAEYNYLEADIGSSLGSRYNDIRNKFDMFIAKTVRASSIVECINSLIRPYLFLKKAVPGKFLALLQFYFNTRKYRRSRKPERVGKSPVEMLTGNNYPNPLAILGY
jgi:hypothetical protein